MEHVPIKSSTFSGDVSYSHKFTGKNNQKPDVEKLGACAFVPCPMATCALKCVVGSVINLVQLTNACSYDEGWQ